MHNLFVENIYKSCGKAKLKMEYIEIKPAIK
jgi:hypothetical protein